MAGSVSYSIPGCDRLPTEIIDQIVSWYAGSPGPHYKELARICRELLPLCLINKAFLKSARSRLYCDLLIYAELDAKVDSDAPIRLDQTGELIRRTLLERPDLAAHTRFVKLICYDESNENFGASGRVVADSGILSSSSGARLVELLGVFTSARKLELYVWSGRLNTAQVFMHLLSKAVKIMPSLKDANLDPAYEMQASHAVAQLGQLPDLAKLRWEISCARSDTFEFEYVPPAGAEACAANATLDKVRVLEIGGQRADLDMLLACPRVESLELFALVSGESSMLQPDSTIRAALRSVESTLRSLSITVGEYDWDIVDGDRRLTLAQLQISELPALKEFRIRNWIWAKRDRPEDMYQSFFAGSLEKFSLEFKEYPVYDVDSELDSEFLSSRHTEFFAEALRLENRKASGLRNFQLELKLPNARPLVVEELKKDAVLLESELRQRGIDASVDIVLRSRKDKKLE